MPNENRPQGENPRRQPRNNNAKPAGQISNADIAKQLKNSKFGDFQLTNAIRTAPGSRIKPSQGYRHEIYVDQETQSKVPVVMASASAEKLFPIFLDLIQRLGPVVDVVLESSHEGVDGEHLDLYRESIEMPILISTLLEFEDLLLNDGCTGIAVLNPRTPQEVQFEEHKLLIVYGSPLEQFEFTLENHGVPENQKMKLITEGEHIHASTDSYLDRFYQLRAALGLDSDPDQKSFANEEDTLPFGEMEDYQDDSHDEIYGEFRGDTWRDSYGDDNQGGLL